MGTLARRIAQLERQGGGQQGAGVWGIRRVHHLTKAGPDVVLVPSLGEELTAAEFRRRFPRGLLISRLEYRARPPGDGAA